MLGIYCRISREKDEGKDRSIEDQEMTGIELAKSLNLDYRIYKDEGKSGTLPIDKRPNLNRLVDDIYSGTITAVFAIDQARFERNPEVRYVLLEVFKKHKIKVYLEKKLQGTNIESELIGNIVSLFNHYYTRQTARRIVSVQKRLAEQGKALAINPFGYTADDKGFLVIDETNRETVTEIFEMSLKGIGTASIAKHLNELGVRKNHYNGTRKSKKFNHKWVGNNVLDIIKNPIYKGDRIRNGITYKVQGIISSDKWHKVNKNLQNNKTSRGIKRKYNYLLKGVVRCGACESNYTGIINRANRTRNYKCSSKIREGVERCKNRSINIDALESIVWNHIESGVLEDSIIKHIKKQSKSDAVKKLETKIRVAQKNVDALNRKIDKLLDKWLNDDFDDDIFKTKKDKLIQERDLNQSNLDRYNYELGLYKSETDENELLNYLRAYIAMNRYISGKSDKLPTSLQGLTIGELKKMRSAFNSDINQDKVFMIKRDVIQKVLSKVNIYFDDTDRYYIELMYNIPQMQSTIITTDWKYKNILDLTNQRSSIKQFETINNIIENEFRGQYLEEFISIKKDITINNQRSRG